MVAFKQWITHIDVFGVNIALRINNEKTSKTFLGAIFTIILYLFITALFWYLILDVILHQNPITYIEPNILDYRPNITIDKETMPIAIGLFYHDKPFTYKQDYFQLSASLVNVNLTNPEAPIFSGRDLKLEKCDPKKHFTNLTLNVFQNIMENYLCLEDQSVTIGGFWDTYALSYLSLTANYCDSVYSETPCADKKEVEQFLLDNVVYFNLYFQDTGLNLANYTDPNTKYAVNKYQILSPTNYKSYELFMKNQTLSSDEGFLLSQKKTSHSLTFDYAESDNGPLNSVVINEIMIYSSFKSEIHHRSYTKIQAVAASIGGIANALIPVCYIVCFIFSVYKRDELILNEIFDFDDYFKNLDEIKPKKVNKKRDVELVYLPTARESEVPPNPPNENENQSNTPQIMQMNNFVMNDRNQQLNNSSIIAKAKIERLNKNNTLKQIIQHSNTNTNQIEQFESNKDNSMIPNFVNNNNNNLNLDKIIEKLNHKKKITLDFSTSDIIKYYVFRCCIKKPLRNKFSLYKKCKNVLDRFLDISFIIKKLDEFEKFKTLILNDEQVKVFNYVSKDHCSLNKNLLHHSLTKMSTRNMATNKIIDGILENYLKHSNILENDVDIRLLKLLQDDISYIL